MQVRYGAAEAVRGLDITVSSGEVLGLIGPDGAGKTSSLRVLAGLLRPAGGRAEAFGLPIWPNRRALHGRIGYLAQRFALYGDLTVDENIQFFALLYSVPGWRKRRDELLERVTLTRFRHRLADRLSGGMKQKLALACTLIHSPEALLLDEPTTGVDPVTRRELWRLLGELVVEGLTLVVATPYLDEAERCSRVVLMKDGQVLADARPGELQARLPGHLVEVSGGPRAAVTRVLKNLEGVADLSVFGACVHVRLEGISDPIGAVRAALAGAGITSVHVREIRPSLEDTFLYLTGSKPEGAQGEVA
ncbi:MAG: ABC transporter ATP-binding protein [Acidobacteria bacterium]|nr:ABC transporter ATP-binding protein [Acidobacteriota bacterium]